MLLSRTDIIWNRCQSVVQISYGKYKHIFHKILNLMQGICVTTVSTAW